MSNPFDIACKPSSTRPRASSAHNASRLDVANAQLTWDETPRYRGSWPTPVYSASAESSYSKQFHGFLPSPALSPHPSNLPTTSDQPLGILPSSSEDPNTEAEAYWETVAEQGRLQAHAVELKNDFFQNFGEVSTLGSRSKKGQYFSQGYCAEGDSPIIATEGPSSSLDGPARLFQAGYKQDIVEGAVPALECTERQNISDGAYAEVSHMLAPLVGSQEEAVECSQSPGEYKWVYYDAPSALCAAEDHSSPSTSEAGINPFAPPPAPTLEPAPSSSSTSETTPPILRSAKGFVLPPRQHPLPIGEISLNATDQFWVPSNHSDIKFPEIQKLLLLARGGPSTAAELTEEAWQRFGGTARDGQARWDQKTPRQWFVSTAHLSKASSADKIR